MPKILFEEQFFKFFLLHFGSKICSLDNFFDKSSSYRSAVPSRLRYDAFQFSFYKTLFFDHFWLSARSNKFFANSLRNELVEWSWKQLKCISKTLLDISLIFRRKSDRCRWRSLKVHGLRWKNLMDKMTMSNGSDKSLVYLVPWIWAKCLSHNLMM